MRYTSKLVEDPTKPKQNGTIRLMCISDTHGHHNDIPQSQIFPTDFFLFAGDLTMFGNPNDAASFKKWVLSLPCTYKVVIPGNIDLSFDTQHLEHFKEKIIQKCNLDPKNSSAQIESVKQNFISNQENFYYIENQKIEIGGLKIFGSPHTAEFMDFAFQFPNGTGKNKYKKLIIDGHNDDIDVLITHGPPKEVCDRTKAGENWGDEELNEIDEEIQPSLHIFGHIHEAHGHSNIGKTLCCNVAAVNEKRIIVNPPTYVDLIPIDKK